MAIKKKKEMATINAGPVGGTKIGSINSTANSGGVPSSNSAASNMSISATLKGAKKGVTQAQREPELGNLSEQDIAGMKDSDSPSRMKYLEKLKKRIK